MESSYKIVVSEYQLATLIQALRLLNDTVKEMSHADEKTANALSECYFKLTNAPKVEVVYYTSNTTKPTFSSKVE